MSEDVEEGLMKGSGSGRFHRDSMALGSYNKLRAKKTDKVGKKAKQMAKVAVSTARGKKKKKSSGKSYERAPTNEHDSKGPYKIGDDDDEQYEEEDYDDEDSDDDDYTYNEEPSSYDHEEEAALANLQRGDADMERAAREASEAARRLQLELQRQDSEVGGFVGNAGGGGGRRGGGGGFGVPSWPDSISFGRVRNWYLVNRARECAPCRNRLDACSRSRKMRLGAGLVVVVAFSVAGLALLLSGSSGDGNKHTNANANGGGGGGATALGGTVSGRTIVPEPPSDVRYKCNAASVATLGGKNACFDACAPAACCHKEEREGGCLADNERNCAAYYGPCAILVVGGETAATGTSSTLGGDGGDANDYYDVPLRPVPPADPDLEFSCSLKTDHTTTTNDATPVVTHVEKCREYCRPGACCLADGPRNCFAENEDRCEGYVPCVAIPAGEWLGASSASMGDLVPAPEEIDLACSPHTAVAAGKSPFQRCEEACQPGLCCIGAGGDNCSGEQDREICDSYRVCRATAWKDIIKNGADDGSGLQFVGAAAPSVLTPIEAICASPTDRGRALCDEACAHGSCCQTGDCLESSAAVCRTYEACPDHGGVGGGGYDSLGWSAFGPQGLGGGGGSSGSSGGGRVFVPASTTPLSILCEASNLEVPSGLDGCKRACSAGSCCFSDGGNPRNPNCFADNEEVCGEYTPCLALPEGGAGGGGETTMDAYPPLEVMCSAARVATEEGQAACSELCFAGSCCFEDGPDGGCFADDEVTCLQYEPCRSLTYVPSPPSNLLELCSDGDGDGEFSATDCARACSKALCCFVEGPGNCEASNEWQCGEYGPCREVAAAAHPPSGGSGAHEVGGMEESPLAALCSRSSLASEEGWVACASECESARCCLESSRREEEYCLEDSPDFCSEYLPYCRSVIQSSAAGGSEYLPGFEDITMMSPVEMICSELGVSTASGRAQCEEECNHVSCCESKGSFNCYEGNESWCDEHVQVCKILQVDATSTNTNGGGGGKEVPFSPSNLDDVCSTESLKTFEGTSRCEKMCEAAACCFAEGRDSCLSDNADACASWKSCEVLQG